MGRSSDGGDYGTAWSPPTYTVDDAGKVQGGYEPTGPYNWGRWGGEDQRGAQNLIGPEQIVAAAGLVQRGRRSPSPFRSMPPARGGPPARRPCASR